MLVVDGWRRLPRKVTLVSEMFYAVALLACPVGMGAMMWILMRGNNRNSSSSGTVGADELTSLRAEVDQLRAPQRPVADSTEPR